MSESHSPSRRDFLKTSSLAVAGAALAGELAVARSAHAAGSEEMKVVLIGCGGRGGGAIGDCLKAGQVSKMKLRLVGMADAFDDNARRLLKALQANEDFKDSVDVPEERIFSGFDAYQKALALGPDMVILATPPGLRPIHYQAAVAAGKHIFMEKPCCVDAPGYRTLVEANKVADQKGLKVGVGLQRHHQAPYLETIQRIHDGAIGEVKFLRVYWNDAGVWTRDRAGLEKLAGRKLTEMEYQVRNWYYFVWLCGDHIVEQHVHNLDIANWVKQGQHPVSAVGMGGRQVTKGPDHGTIFDHHAVEFTYADGTKLFSQARHIPQCWTQVREFAHGTKGVADCSGVIEGETPWKYRGTMPCSPGVQEHIDLQNAILKGEKYHEGHYAADSTFTAVLGRMATYSGQEVKWDEAVAQGPSEMPSVFAWDAAPPVMPDAQGSYEGSVPVPGITKPY